MMYLIKMYVKMKKMITHTFVMQAADTYRTESTHASIQKSYASQEVNRLRKDLEITKRDRDQVKFV
jgi:hypothetical protein